MKDKPEIIQRNPADLIPYARNAKKHSPEQISAIAGSIKEFGFNNPVLIDGDNGIIAGHGRVQAALKLGMPAVPCIVLDHLSDTQRRAYILADNRLCETGGGWDSVMLSLEVNELLSENVNLEGLNLEELLTIEDNEQMDAEKTIFEQSVQMEPGKEFMVIIMTNEEYEEAKNLLRLKQVRRGGYKNSSAFDSVGFEKCITWKRVADVLNEGGK
jgi:hypothetical protein